MVTHQDDPSETHLVRQRRRHRRRARPSRADAGSTRNDAELQRPLARAAPGFLFSFYYRSHARRGAAAVPRARRLQHARLAAAEVPRPRAGQLGGAARRARDRRDAARHDRSAPMPATSSTQQAVPILPDDDALRGVRQGDGRRRDAGALAAARCIAGTAPHLPQDRGAASTSAGAARGWRASTGRRARAAAQPGARGRAALPGGLRPGGRRALEDPAHARERRTRRRGRAATVRRRGRLSRCLSRRRRAAAAGGGR